MKKLFFFFLAITTVSVIAKKKCLTVFEALVEKSVEPGEGMGLDVTTLKDFLTRANKDMTEEQRKLLEEYFSLAKTYLELEDFQSFFPAIERRIKTTTGEISDEVLEGILTDVLKSQPSSRLRNSPLIKSILFEASKKLLEKSKYFAEDEMRNQLRDILLIKFADFESRFFEMISRPPVLNAKPLLKPGSTSKLIRLADFDETLSEIHDNQLQKKVAEIVTNVSSKGIEGESAPRKPVTGYPGVYEFKLRIQPGYRIYFMKIPKSENVLFLGIVQKPKEGHQDNYSVLQRTYIKAIEFLQSIKS